MTNVCERCVILKNIPPGIQEPAVREALDLAHGDFCFQDKYEKLHRHEESPDDVRWIVLFKSSEDGIDCIKRGSWGSDVVRGGCRVIPDYCSGCIIPDEWEEEIWEDETMDWNFTNISDSIHGKGSFENVLKSFVVLGSFPSNKTESDQEESDVEEASPSIGIVDGNGKQDHTDNLMETMPLSFNNDFESCDTESSDGLFGSGKPAKEEKRITEKGSDRAKHLDNSIIISGERLSSSELFGSGNGKTESKERQKTNFSRTGDTSRSKLRELNDGVDEKGEGNNVSSSELFGSGFKREDKRKQKSPTREVALSDLTSVNQNDPSVSEDTTNTIERKEAGKKAKSTQLDGPSTIEIVITNKGDETPLFQVENVKINEAVVNMPFSKSNAMAIEHTGVDDTKAEDSSANRHRGSKNLRSASIRSADLFGSGNDDFQSLEFAYDKTKDQSHEKRPDIETRDNSAKSENKESEAPKRVKSEVSETEIDIPVNAPNALNEQTTLPFPPQPWIANYFNQQMIQQNMATYMPIAAGGQHLNEENASMNNMGYYMNPLYQMPYTSGMPHMPQHGTGQTVDPSGMTMPPVMFVPIYMHHGMPPNCPAEADSQSKDRKEFDTKNEIRNHIQSLPQDVVSDQIPKLPKNQDGITDAIGNSALETKCITQPTEPVSQENDTRKVKRNETELKGNKGKRKSSASIGFEEKVYSHEICDNLYITPCETAVPDYELPRTTLYRECNQRDSFTRNDETELPRTTLYRECNQRDSFTRNDETEHVYEEIDESRLMSMRSTSMRESCGGDYNPNSAYAIECPPPSLMRKAKPKIKTQTENKLVDEYDEVRIESNKDDEKKELNQENNRIILVKGISTDISIDALELYFENQKRTGGGEIESTDVKETEAIIVFKNWEDALEVTNRASSGHKFILQGHELIVCKYRPPPSDSSKVPVGDLGQESSRMILVKGISADMSIDALELYFENKKKTGGGDVNSSDINIKKAEAVIEFKNREDALEVINKAASGHKFTLQRQELTVCEYRPPPSDQLKVFVRNIAESTTSECIINFITKPAGSEPLTVVFGETPGTAMVCFDIAPDVSTIKKFCTGRKCEGKTWNISAVPLTRSVQVIGVTKQTSSESLCLYFENKRRSKGGDVENVKNREKDVIVTFVNAQDAERVCNTTHNLGGQELSVSLHYPCLELDDDFMVQIPPPLLVEDLDEYIYKFILNNESYKAELESRIRSVFGQIVWSSPTCENKNMIQIICTVDQKDKTGGNKVKNWTTKCLSAVKEVTDRLCVTRSRNVAEEAWSALKERLREIEVSDPEAVAVVLESRECVVVIVGETMHVKRMSTHLDVTITDVEKTLELERQIITKKKRLKTYELALLRASRLVPTLNKTPIELEIDNENREVTCKGKQKDVDDAISKIDCKLKSYVNKPVPGMTRPAIDLLFKKEARDYIKKKLNEKRVTGVWDVVKGSVLVMYSKNEKELNIAIEIVQKSIVMDSFELDSGKDDILASREGKAKIAEFEDKHKGYLHFKIQANEFSFVCVDNLYQDIKDEFSRLFDLHSMISTFVPTDPGTFSYIVAYKRREIEAAEQQYKRLSVFIEEKYSPTKPGFQVKGKKDGCKLAVNKLQSLIDSVFHKDHVLPWPGFDQFLQSSGGIDSIKSIELSEKCVIKVSAATLSSGLERPTAEQVYSPDRRYTSSRITREIKIGSLALESVDVMVNSTNHNLDLNVGAISRTLLKAGGDQLVQECQTNYPDGLKIGQLAITTGGDLKCKKLFHGLLIKWDGGQGSAQRVMEHFVNTCLSLASRHNYSSIAFPALGTGALGFPADVVAKTMFDIVDAFEEANPTTSLRNIRIVVWFEDRLTTKAFQDAESRIVRRRASSRASPDTRQSYRHTASGENLYVKSEGFSTTIGQVSVSIVQGDLTTLTSGAIVNSTMDDLNLNSGAVSKAILHAAGDSIQNEASAQKRQFETHGLVVTNPGKLMCQRIIHVRARNNTNGWTETIRKCLLFAEGLGLISIAFPALGTGGKGVSPDRMSRIMIETFRDFIQSTDFKKCLKSISIVIYDKHLLDAFITEAKTTLDPTKTAKRKSLLPELKDLKFWEHKPAQETKPSLTMHIYAGSEYSMKSAVTKINEIRREKDLFVPRNVYEYLDDTHKRDLKRIGYTCSAKIIIERGRVKVMGYGGQADSAINKAKTYIDNVGRDMTRNVASSVKLPSNWTKMKLSDPTQIISLLPRDRDYITVSQKFERESGFSIASIVNIERIQNPTLFMQYLGKKQQMEMANSGGRSVEQQLWHGTSGTAVDNINKKGFDRNYNSGASHGVGVYFAMKASTSVQGYCRPDAKGHKHIYFAHVLTGEYCVGQGGIRVPPTRTSAPSTTYDSTTDNVQNPNFFVIFHDAQAYPSFHITFK